MKIIHVFHLSIILFSKHIYLLFHNWCKNILMLYTKPKRICIDITKYCNWEPIFLYTVTLFCSELRQSSWIERICLVAWLCIDVVLRPISFRGQNGLLYSSDSLVSNSLLSILFHFYTKWLLPFQITRLVMHTHCPGTKVKEK